MLNTRKTIEEEGKRKGKLYFLHYYKLCSKPWFHQKNLPREITVTISRCRSEHINLAKSLCRIGIFTEEKCSCGYESQDLNHVIWQCPLFDSQRTELLRKLNKLHLYLPLDIKLLLIKPDIPALSCICDFFKKCNLRISFCSK